jgi:orotidine-5'-phosphate decarboxylase
MHHQPVHPHERIFAALDLPDLDAAAALAATLTPVVGGFKVGLELCNAHGTPEVVRRIAAVGGSVFLDLKLHDIPNTVARTIQALGAFGGAVRMLTLHTLGGAAMMQAAANAAATLGPNRPLLLGVTVLTSHAPQALHDELHVVTPLDAYVLHLAQMAQVCGLDGVVASAQEAAGIRALCGPDLLIVTPGIRPTWASDGDQQRTLTPAAALHAGADYLVIGRPITNPPPAFASPAAAAAQIAAELKEAVHGTA